MKAILVERSGRLNDARQWLVILLLTVTSLGVAVASGAQSVEVDARGNWSVRAPAPEPWRQAAGSRAQAEHEGDRAALIELYNATDGANWTNATNWNSSAPIVEWYGVSTDDDGRVSRLYLYRNNLTGSIPPSLGNLANLEWLNQSNLTGSIPPSLGNLANLEGLPRRRGQSRRRWGTWPTWNVASQPKQPDGVNPAVVGEPGQPGRVATKTT